MGRKEENGKVLYKVHWKGYSSRYDTWEPDKNLLECEDLIARFLKDVPQVSKGTSNTLELITARMTDGYL